MRGPFQTLPSRETGLSYDRGALDYDPSTGRCVRADPLPTTRRPAPTTEVTLLCPGVELNLRFPGQYRDAETGLFYNYFRDYDAQTGRYVQSDPIGLAGGINPYLYVGGNPLAFADPHGLNPGTMVGGWIGTIVMPGPGTIAGAAIGTAIAVGAGWAMYNKPPEDARSPEGAKAPGKPGEAEGFKDPKGGENWVPNPNGPGHGWQDADGNVWCPTGPGRRAHGGPHWDVQKPGGGYVNVYPGGRRR